MAQDGSGKTQNGENLDITQVGSDDLDQLAQQIEGFYKQDSTVKTRLAYHWERNHNFLDGNQWIVFDGQRETGGTWQRLTVNKANEYIPRPVTNYIFDAYQTLKAYLIKNKPRSTVRANTQTAKDKNAAKIAELVLETNWERLSEQENYEYCAAVVLAYGTVFKKSYWDTTVINMAKVPRMVQEPQIDPMTGAQIGVTEKPATDPMTGEPLFDEVPLGDVSTDVIEPYRIALDPLAADLHKARWIMEYAIQPLDWIKETYGKQAPGYTGLVDELKEETQLQGSMKRYYELKNSAGVKNAFKNENGGNSGEPLTNCAVVKEYYERPTVQYPKGRLIVVANGKTLYAGDSPCTGPEQGDWHPYSDCRWEIVPGRFWGKSPLDAACDIQKRINSIDALIELTRKTMAAPQKLVPTGSGIARGSWTGRPGQQIEYKADGTSKPEILPGVGVDPSVIQERAQLVEDLKNITGAIDILKGDRPDGVQAASALSMLYEVGTGKLFPTLDRWKRFVERDQKKQLKLVHENYQEPRPDFIRIMMMKNTSLSKQSISQFLGSDLLDNCNVIVEAGSNIPKLQAAQQQRLAEAAQNGSLGLDTSPQNRAEYNRQMGIVGFDDDVGPDMERAEWENDLLDATGTPNAQQPVVLDCDDHAIHLHVHQNRMKEPSFMDEEQAVQQAYMAHIQQHEDMQAQKEQAAQLQAMQSGQPSQGVPSGGDPKKSVGRGRGTTAEMKNALASDALVPGMPK